MKATKTRSNFSKREKMRRKPLRRRKSLSISFRFLYKARSYSHGSMRLDLGGTSGTVHRVFQLFAVQPHRSKNFKLSNDPFFVEKVRDVVGLYLNPPDHAIVLSVDEKSQPPGSPAGRSTVKSHDQLYRLLSGDALQVAGCVQRSTAVDR